MRDGTTSTLKNREAHAYIIERLGDLAPTWQTWQTWVRPSGRARSPAITRERCVPRPVRVPGIRAHLFRVGDLDIFINKTLELSETVP